MLDKTESDAIYYDYEVIAKGRKVIHQSSRTILSYFAAKAFAITVMNELKNKGEVVEYSNFYVNIVRSGDVIRLYHSSLFLNDVTIKNDVQKELVFK